MFEKRNSKYFLVFMIGLIFLLVVRDILGISYNKFILVGFVLLFSVLVSSDEISTMICFIFSLTWGLPYTYIFLGTIVLYWIKRKKIPAPAFVLLAVFTILEFTTSAFYPIQDYAGILKYISVIAIFFTFLYDSEIDKERCIKAYYYGSITLCVIILLTTLRNAPSNWLYLFSQGRFRFGSLQAESAEGMMLSVNANTLAYYSVIGTVLSYYFLSAKKGSKRWLHIFALMLFLISGVFTVSITWIVAIAVCTLFYIFAQTKSVKAVILSATVMMSIVIIAIIAISRTPELLTAFTSRLNRVDLSTGHSRTNIFIEYHRAFWNNRRFIFLGTGVTQYRQVINIHNSLHNMLQQIFVCYGIVAGIVFLVGMFYPLKKLGKHSSTLLNWLPMVAVLFFTQTIQFVNPPSLMLPYVIALYILKGDDNEKIHNNS